MMAPSTATVRVKMLDNTIHTYDVKVKNFGTVLLRAVMEDLNLLEADYFGIQYKDKEGNLVFLDPLKKIKSQIKNINNVVLQFVVKFFPPDPGQLQEEYTRYLFALQVKRDITTGLLPSSDQTMIGMASCIAQADFGDWNANDCADHMYLRDINLLPPTVNPEDRELLINISESHRQKMGKTSADADYQLLDIARHLDRYGLRLHPAKDQENAEISLAVANIGIVVFRGNAKINTFNWSRIRKLSFKKKRFLIKLRTEANSNSVGDILEFVMASRNTCKNFWRNCIEYHAFFRLEVHPERKPQPMVLKRGSTFRYSGKTQKQLHELVRNSNFRRTAFVRASSHKPSAAKQKRHSFDAPVTVKPPVMENGSNAEAMPHLPLSDIPSPISHHSEAREHDISERVVMPSPTEHRVSDGSHKAYEGPRDEPAPSQPQSPSHLAAQAWQVESKHLHSSVAIAEAEQPRDQRQGNKTMHGDVDANGAVWCAVDRSEQLPSPDLLKNVARSNVVATTDAGLTTPPPPSSPARTNDNRAAYVAPPSPISRNILSIESVSSSSRSSVSRSSTGKSSSSFRYKSQQPLPPPPPPPAEPSDAPMPEPPPLPPKSSRLASPKQETHGFEHVSVPYIDSSADDRDSSTEVLSIAPVRGLRLSHHGVSPSGSEISIPGMGGGVKRTPSQYAAIEKKMIKAGFYAAPSKPPVPPSVREDSQLTNDDIDRALGELDMATRSLNCGDSDRTVSSMNDSHGGMFGVVADSDSEGASPQRTPVNSTAIDQDLMAPIAMNFTDRYRGPDYGSQDALSSFAIEMEASFDRIRQSMSTDGLHKSSANAKGRPVLTSSMDVLSMRDVDAANERTGDASMLAGGYGANPNNNNSCRGGPPNGGVWTNRYTVDL